jgi:hypothetical protein
VVGVISARSIDEPDEIVSGPRVAKRIVTVGKTSIARIECQPGWRWSRDLKPTAKRWRGARGPLHGVHP